MAHPDQYLRVLDHMQQHGADLSKPAHVLFYLYFKSLDQSKAAADQLYTEGYKAAFHQTRPASLWQRFFGPKSFSCIAETRMVPSESNLSAAIDRMEALAAKFGGEYDGWEASIER
jgi:Regulator of ribonuclease activity B